MFETVEILLENSQCMESYCSLILYWMARIQLLVTLLEFFSLLLHLE